MIRQHETTQREMLRMAMKVKDVGSKETQIIALEGKCFRLEQENGTYFRRSSEFMFHFMLFIHDHN